MKIDKKIIIKKYMNSDKYYSIIKDIVTAKGISGHEGGVISEIKKYIYSSIKNWRVDSQQSLTVELKQNSPSNKLKVLIDTHMDEIGFLVSDITDKGFIKFTPVGGWWSHTILSQKFVIMTKQKTFIVGVCGSIPIHILPKNQIKFTVDIADMYLDVGAKNRKEVIDSGICIGSPIFKKNNVETLINKNLICAKAFDNRASVASSVATIRDICDEKYNSNIYYSFSSQEEVGLRGVKTNTYYINPHIAIVLDTTISHDQPTMEKHNDCTIGKKVVIEVLDALVNSNKKFLEWTEELLKKNNIKYSYSVLTGGGTNGGYVYNSRKGVITLVLSIPIRYMHTHIEVMDISNALETIKFIKIILKSLTYEKYLEFLNN